MCVGSIVSSSHAGALVGCASALDDYRITERPRQHCAALLGRAQAPRRREYFLFKGADGLICFVVQPVSAGGLDVSKVDRM